MQDGVEQQLLTCQEMFLEIEAKVAGLSALSPAADPQQSDDLGAQASQRDTAELLSSRLEVLKANLVSCQQLLQDAHEEERTTGDRQAAEQTPTRSLPSEQHGSKLKRSSSVQEIFSLPRNKVLRQNSLQQQKELQQELSEQKELTQVISRQTSRARLFSQDQPLPRSSPAEARLEEDSAQKWDHLHCRLLALEKSVLLPPSQVPDSSVEASDGTAGCMIGSKYLKELQTSIRELRELGHTSSELLNQVCSVEKSLLELEERLFHVLHGSFLSLSAINNLLLSPAETARGEDAHLRLLLLQSWSAELASLGSELASQGSKVSCVLGSEGGQKCLEDLCRVLPVVQSALTDSQRRLLNLEQDAVEKQRRLTELLTDFTSNRSTVVQLTEDFRGRLSLKEQLQAGVQVQETLQQQAEQLKSLLEEATQHNLPASVIQQTAELQDELDSQLSQVCSLCEELRSSVDIQQQLEHLVHSLKQILHLGSERLSQHSDLKLHSRTQLQQQLSSHTKFFQFLVHHSDTLLDLTDRVPDSTLQRWTSVTSVLQDQVVRLQQQGLDEGIRMQETLQTWTLWEEDSIWSDCLLRSMETSFPMMQEEGDSEEQVSQNLSIYKNLCSRLEESEARFSQMLERGRRLQGAGCRGVGESVLKLDARWRSVQKRLERERTIYDRRRKVRSRFLCDSAELSDWMKKATQLVDKWSQLEAPVREQMEVQQRRDSFLQSVALSKHLKDKSDLRVTVIGAAAQLLQSEADKEEDAASPRTQTSHQDLQSISTGLRQVEQDWSKLETGLPVIQEALHKLWMEKLKQQGALLELQVWLRGTESQLEDHQSRIKQNLCTNTDLIRLLKSCRDSQTETSAHQATLDYVNQPLQMCHTDTEQRRRYICNQYAEQLGRVNHQWVSVKKLLQAQTEEVEQQLRDRLQQDARLQQINIWVADQNLWINSALTPSSQSELQRSIRTCEDLEDKILRKCAALQELRDKMCDPSEKRRSQTESSAQACAALTQQNTSVKERLILVQQLWSRMETDLNHMVLKTIRTAQTLGLYSSPGLTLKTSRRRHEKLQLLSEEARVSDSEWDELSETVVSLRGAVSPAAAATITHQLEQQRDSWNKVLEALSQKLQRSRDVLLVWEVYSQLLGSLSEHLQTLQRAAASELSDGSRLDRTVEQVAVRIKRVQSLLNRTCTLQSDLEPLLLASKKLVSHLETSAAGLVQSESRLLSRGVLQLSLQLSGRLDQLQEELKLLREFEDDLESVETSLEVWQQLLEDAAQTDQSDLLEPSSLSADLDLLNQLSCSLTLSDAAARRLQRLNHCWTSTSTRAQDLCSELQAEALRLQSFEQKCESWMAFLQKMEDGLAVDVSGSYVDLRKQLCTHKRFQAELAIGHQILHAVISEGLDLLQKGEVEDRSDFLLRLAQLREHWQGAVRRADQRSSLVLGLLRHWHQYSRSLRRLQRFLSDTQTLLPVEGATGCSLQQLRRSVQDLQHTELLFQSYQNTLLHTLEVGRQLYSVGDQETQAQLQTDLGTLQEEWDNLHSLLDRRMDLTEAILKNWENCQAGLSTSVLQLKNMKTRLNQSVPDYDSDLEGEEKFNKENEDSLEDWADSLTELSSMKTDLSQYIIGDDILLLQEQVEHLHCQWEELCFKVSLRKQEIADRLNAWIIFNEKNKELCEWLTQMESKVEHNSYLSIEEMVEKLKKDCMEEINLFSENKSHLKQLGEQLITASNKAKETEINDTLRDVNDRWQHLFDHIQGRVRKLKDTYLTVQQLDKNMSNLRTWLSRIEADLAKPVVYDVCHSKEIQKKLAEQQDLQRDIEQHTESVASVLTLCDVLLHDADACGGDSENDSIQQTSRSLDRRWRNICAMSMERRMRIEETWRLWCKFLDDYSHFEDWLKSAEVTAASPESANVLYTNAKEELKKFEAFQRQVHERLTQLELVNKQYHRLARENRTDAASRLRVMVQDGNQRWDRLQRRVAAVLRRLKHFTSQREDFEGTREGILVWLTEMDLQLTNVEHFSESDVEDKMRQLKGFQQEITMNTNKIDALIVFGENLIQKSAPLDAVLIEDELEELHSYCQEVFGRVARFHHRLVNRRPVLDEEKETSDQEMDLDDSPDVTSRMPWTEVRRKKEEDEAPAGRQVMCHLLVPPPEHSGRETPVSVDSIPLEWDHTVDVGGSSSHEEDEDVTFYSAVSVKSVTDPPSWHQPGSPEIKQIPRELIVGLSSSQTSSTPLHQQGYAKLMSECSGSINRVKRIKLILNDDEELEEAGLTSSVANKQTSTGVIERWELQQAQSFSTEPDLEPGLEPDLERWQKLDSDLCDVTSWLGRAVPELERLQRIAPSTSIRDIEVNIKKLKEMQKTFNSYKCLMISINLSAHHALQGHSVELRELQEALSSANQSWSQACGGLESWERRLHSALMQCQEFHEVLRSLLMWLSEAESKLGSVNMDRSPPQSSLLERRATLVELQEQLRSKHRQVLALQEISSQLLLEAVGEESVEAKEKVHVISNKLHLLLRHVASALCSLQRRPETCSAGSDTETLSSPLRPHEEADLQRAAVTQPATRREERREPPPRRPFLFRVLRAAFPLQLIFVALLVLICLVPPSEQDYSCTLSNNFARSFYPMLHYTNGPPPT